MPVPSGVLNSGRIGQEQELKERMWIIFIVDLSLMMVLESHGWRYGKQPVEEISCRKSFPNVQRGWDRREKDRTFWKSNLCYYQGRQDFSDQLIKERTGHRSLEALHKYKQTGPDQQYKVSMALLPQIEGKENKKPLPSSMDADDDDDDFIPTKKKPKIKPEYLKAMFEHSSYSNKVIFCIFCMYVIPFCALI